MIRGLGHTTIKYSFLPFISELFSQDKLEGITKTEQLTEIPKNQSQPGWERVKKIFRIDEFGNITPEAHTILLTGSYSLVVGFLLGGFLEGKNAYEKFMRNNEATSFVSSLEAKKKLQDAVIMGIGKGGFRWGTRLTFFCMSFVGISTVIQTYRNKYGILEYLSAGAISGWIYKFYQGPRGWVAGASVGSVLGLTCGLTSLGLLKLTGLSLEEARYWQNKWSDDRTAYIRKGLTQQYENKDIAVLKLHDEEVGEAGKTLENLDKPNEEANLKRIRFEPKTKLL
ncbi:hypothetical protein ABEB36_010568 [Hypothenemus hampei]|uniref:Complex I assembly factor TIMMDC1, mitochondrial n=1 Tax=Hypothenemus hampei TaxID=57062 RepID=A0ABD1EKQ6_HYPHA